MADQLADQGVFSWYFFEKSSYRYFIFSNRSVIDEKIDDYLDFEGLKLLLLLQGDGRKEAVL